MSPGMGEALQSYVGFIASSNALSKPAARFVGTAGRLGFPLSGPFRCHKPESLGTADEGAADWALRYVEECCATTATTAKAMAPVAIHCTVVLLLPLRAWLTCQLPSHQ